MGAYMDYIVTMFNPVRQQKESFDTTGYEQNRDGLNTFELALDTFRDGGYSIQNYQPKPELLTKEQKRIFSLIEKQLDTSTMGVFVSGERSFIVTDQKGDRIEFYSPSDDGPIYDSFHKIDLTKIATL